jgi:two-component system chemotaxis sensor kinase CheA
MASCIHGLGWQSGKPKNGVGNIVMDDLLSEFLTETSENLSVLDVELVRLEQNPNNPELLSNIFRLVHTIHTRTSGFQRRLRRSFPGEGALEPE